MSNKYVQVKFVKLKEDAQIFEYKTEGAACADIYSVEDIILPPFKVVLVPTGISVELPKDYEMKIRPRSGLSLKGVLVANAEGTIDEDYRGEIAVLLLNVNSTPYTIAKGDRIAQAAIQKVIKAEYIETTNLTTTDRGVGGFGSTGK